MAFVLIIFGVLLFVAAYQGNVATLGSYLRDDIIGSPGDHGFLFWVVSILIIGGIGYIKPLKGLSDAFIALLLLVLFLAAGKQGLFKKFNDALKNVGGASVAGTPATSQATFGGVPVFAANSGNF